MEDQEILREFVLESSENLARLDQEIVELEERPRDAELLASVFRTMHTLKGTCGFLGFSAMEQVSHHAENILSQVRSGVRLLEPGLVSLILEAVDMIRRELASVEAHGVETGESHLDLIARLELAEKGGEGAPGKAEEKTGADGRAPSEAELAADASRSAGEKPVHEAPIDEAPVHQVPGNQVPGNQATVHQVPVHQVPGNQAPVCQGPVWDGGVAQTPPTSQVLAGPGGRGAKEVPASEEAREKRVAAKEPATATPSAMRAEEDEESGSSGTRSRGLQESAIRVDVHLLDKLMNLVGELVLARNQIVQFTGSQEDAALSAASQRLDLITTELQEGVMKTRMQPIGVIWSKLPRVVRDLAAACGKQIRLEMDGAETELDKTIIEAIKDPLTHIVRNSCDHGVEEPARRVAAGKPPQGRLLLRAFHEGGHVNIEISDDGGGIDARKVGQRAVERGMLSAEALSRMNEREILQLIFAPGFSTAATVTSISGRGVGMDVVRTNIEKIGGTVDVSTIAGQGTTIKLKIPLTLAIIPGLVITHQGERFVIPQVSLVELIRLERDQAERQIERVHRTPVYRRRGKLLPIAFLSDVLQMQPEEPGLNRAPKDTLEPCPATREGVPPSHGEAVNIVVLQAENQQFGLVVDGISDTQEIVVKPLGSQLKGLNCYAGATIMGDGRVALILDVSGICQLSGIHGGAATGSEAAAEGESSEQESQSFLLFSAGTHERLAVPLGLVARLEEFEPRTVERAAGRLMVQYRGSILPLMPLASVLDGVPEITREFREPVRVVVFSDGNRSVGVLVDQILDIVEGDLSTRRAAARPGILASFVLGGRITDLMDLSHVLREEESGWFGRKGAETAEAKTVVLAEPEPFRRNLLRMALQVGGHRVVETNSPTELLRALEAGRSTVALVSLQMEGQQGQTIGEWLQPVKRQTGARLIAIQEAAEAAGTEPPIGFDALQSVFDQASTLRLVEHLSQGRSVGETVAVGQDSPGGIRPQKPGQTEGKSR
jgi:two-component system chemotaxis sensor kinase CheA